MEYQGFRELAEPRQSNTKNMKKVREEHIDLLSPFFPGGDGPG